RGEEAAAAVLVGGPQRPEARGFRLGRNALAVFLGQLRRVGVDALLDRNHFVADDATDLLAQHLQLVGQTEAGEVHPIRTAVGVARPSPADRSACATPGTARPRRARCPCTPASGAA